MRIDLRQMECFVAVAEGGGFRVAAERLHMSQPPLSRQIKLLEFELGVLLLERGSKGVTLTAAGRRFLKEARGALDQAKLAVDAARRTSEPTDHPLRVGFTTFFDPDIIPGIEPAYRKRMPGGSLDANPGFSVDLLKRLRRNSIDIALVGLPCDGHGLVIEPLAFDPLFVMMSSSHPKSRRKSLSIQELSDEPLFWLTRGINPQMYDHFEEILERLDCKLGRRRPAPVYHLLLLARVARGEGVCLTPRSLTQIRRKGVVFRPLREKEFRVGYGVAYRDVPSTPEREALLAVLRRHAKKHVPKPSPRSALTIAHYVEPAGRHAQSGSKGRSRA
jgi:DNA-binding transcriptional LysR family regulator